MKKHEIKASGHYTARVGGNIVTVRVDHVREVDGGTHYDVTSLATGRRTTFRSAAKFRSEVLLVCKCGNQKPMDAEQCTQCLVAEVSGRRQPEEGEHIADPTPILHTDTAAVQVVDLLCQATSPAICADNDTGAVTTIASRIAATRAGRERGTPVADMVPNEEQEAILEVVTQDGLKMLIVGAGAGTGKTATLKMLEQVLRGNGQYTAFNASLVAEAKEKFKKCAVNTTHSLAFHAVGKLYQHRLGGETVRSEQVARMLGIEPMTVVIKGAGAPIERDTGEWCAAAEAAGYTADNPPPAEWAPHADKTKTLLADFLAGQVLAAVKRFCQSADREIGAAHLRHIDGVDVSGGRENNDRVREYLVPHLKKAWADITRVDGQLPFNHDCYVKLWQLGTGDDRPVISADYILLDEAQDTAPVFLDIIRQQTHALVVLVGDSNQAIYEWRGAVDAMKAFSGSPRRLLSHSYRFGQAIADVANAVLSTLDEPTDLVMRGLPSIPSRVAAVDNPRCYLYRTNAGAIGRCMAAIVEKRKPYLVGSKTYIADMIRWMQAAVDLQARRGTRHPELSCFDTWQEVVDYSKTDEGAEMRLLVKLVDTFGAAKIVAALKNMPASEEEADLVVSTAHKSKGREWDTVLLGSDFPTKNKMSDADRRLLYVAATRAKLTLDVTECPPFCGEPDRADGSLDGWIPGIPITYTAPVPTREEQDARLAAKDAAAQVKTDGETGPTRDATPGAPTAGNGDGARPDVTYAKLRDGSWGLRSSTELRPGRSVTVTTQAGERRTATVGRVVWTDGQTAWLATQGG